MEMTLLQVLIGAQRDGNKTHLEYFFIFRGEIVSLRVQPHTHTTGTIQIELFNLLYYFFLEIQEVKFLNCYLTMAYCF